MSNFETAMQAAEQEYKIVRRRIPEGAIVSAMLLEISLTKAGKEANSFLQGIAAKFCFLDFEHEGRVQPLIDFSGDKIEFPYDSIEKDGTYNFPGIQSKPIYITPGTLRAKQSAVPTSNEIGVLLYGAFVQKKLGKGMALPFVTALLQSGLIDVSKFDFASIGLNIDEIKVDKGAPVCKAFRHTYMKYDKKDLENGKAKPGAQKQMSEDLTVFQKQTNERGLEIMVDVLGEFPITYVPSSKSLQIYDALKARQELKKKQDEQRYSKSNQSTGAYTPGNAYLGGADDDLPF